MNEQYIERYWRDATPADAIKEPPMVARFRQDDEGWIVIALLLGYDRCRQFKWSTPLDQHLPHCFKHCQVYDAPDPGEGWRLIDPDTVKRVPSDERWHPALQKWLSPDDCYSDHYEEGCFYRRRITPVVKYVPFTWVDREELRGRIVTYVGKNRTVEFRCESFAVDDDGLLVNDTYAAWLCKNAVFVDTKEPVGRKVTL